MDKFLLSPVFTHSPILLHSPPLSYPCINPFVNAFRACTEFSHSSLALQPTLWLGSPHFSPVAVTKSCLTVRNLMDCSMLGFPILHLHFSPASLQISPESLLPLSASESDVPTYWWFPQSCPKQEAQKERIWAVCLHSLKKLKPQEECLLWYIAGAHLTYVKWIHAIS